MMKMDVNDMNHRVIAFPNVRAKEKSCSRARKVFPNSHSSIRSEEGVELSFEFCVGRKMDEDDR